MSVWRRASLERRVPMWMVVVVAVGDEVWVGGGCMVVRFEVCGSISIDVILLTGYGIYTWDRLIQCKDD